MIIATSDQKSTSGSAGILTGASAVHGSMASEMGWRFDMVSALTYEN